MSVHNGSHTGEHTQRCSQTWAKGTLFRDSCLESQNRGWPHRCRDEWFVRNTKKKHLQKSFSNQSEVLWDEKQQAEPLLNRASVYGGFPAIASLTAGEQLHLQTFICSLLSLNNGGQFQEKAAGEEVVTTSPLVSVFTTLMFVWAQISVFTANAEKHSRLRFRLFISHVTRSPSQTRLNVTMKMSVRL